MVLQAKDSIRCDGVVDEMPRKLDVSPANL